MMDGIGYPVSHGLMMQVWEGSIGILIELLSIAMPLAVHLLQEECLLNLIEE